MRSFSLITLRMTNSRQQKVNFFVYLSNQQGNLIMTLMKTRMKNLEYMMQEIQP